MSKSIPHIQTSFNAGEWSPRFAGRFDLAKYGSACETIENFTIDIGGSLTRRSGTRFITSTKNDGEARLISFLFNEEQSYIIELGNIYARFFRDRAVLGGPLDIVSPYTFAQVEDLVFTQANDIVYFTHADVHPHQLNRNGDLDWEFVHFEFQDGPYGLQNTTSTTLEVSASTGTATLTASSIVGINNDEGFKSTDVERLIRYQGTDSKWTWFEITDFTDTTHVTIDIKGPDTVNTGTPSRVTTWRLGAWSDTDGWPYTVTFHQGRLWFAGNDESPNTIWSSRTGDFTNFSPSDIDGTVLDDSAVTFTIADEANQIRWIHSSSKGLMVGSQGGEHLVAARSSLDPITPSTIASSRQGAIGSGRSIPVLPIAGSILFVQRSYSEIHELFFRFSEDEYTAPSLTIFAEHLTSKTKIKQVAFQHEHENLVWVVYEDGTLAASTLLREQDVNGWHRHCIGTSLEDEASFVESIAVVPDELHDLLYLIVKRTINGGVKRYVEFVENRFEIDTDIADAYFVDSGLSYDGSAATVFSGLDHLEGEVVSVLADGAARPNTRVSQGAITIDDPAAEKVHVGLPYSSSILTLPLALKDSSVSIGGVDQPKVVSDISIQFFQTVGAKTGVDGGELERIIFRDVEDLLGQAVAPFTGWERVSASAGQQKQTKIRVVQDQPLPMTILSLVTELKVDKA